MKTLGVVLILGGAGALLGFILWLIYREPTMHLAVKIIVPIVIVGFVVLFGVVIRERRIAMKKERFEESEE